MGLGSLVLGVFVHFKLNFIYLIRQIAIKNFGIADTVKGKKILSLTVLPSLKKV